MALPFRLEAFHKINSSAQNELETMSVNRDPEVTKGCGHTICKRVL